jgi:Fe-S-cluster containining protein
MFAVEIVDKAPYVYEMQKNPRDGKCLFLQGNECTIYAVRPLICRFYPFELSTKEEGTYSFRVTDECPGVFSQGTKGVGKKLDAGFFRALLELARVELNCRSR